MVVKTGCHFVCLTEVSLIHSHPHIGQIITRKTKEFLIILNLRRGLQDFMRGNPDSLFFLFSFFIFRVYHHICCHARYGLHLYILAPGK